MQSSYSTSTHYPVSYPASDDRLSGGETWLLMAAFTTLLVTLAITFV